MTVEEKDGEKEKQTMENLGAKQSKKKKNPEQRRYHSPTPDMKTWNRDR